MSHTCKWQTPSPISGFSKWCLSFSNVFFEERGHISLVSLFIIIFVNSQNLLSVVMLTSSNGNILRVTGHLCGEFTGHRPVARYFFFDLHPNKRLSKQSWGWWFETPSRSWWHHCNGQEQEWFHIWSNYWVSNKIRFWYQHYGTRKILIILTFGPLPKKSLFTEGSVSD